MKIRISELRQLIREALSGDEGSGVLPDTYAVFAVEESDSFTAYVYDFEIFKSVLMPKPVAKPAKKVAKTSARQKSSKVKEPAPSEAKASLKDAVRASMKGYIQAESPEAAGVRGNCAGAWVIAFSIGKGLGKLLYGMVYAASPKGLVTPDRVTVSSSAYAGWQKASASRKSVPLDDIDNPKTRKKSDDCEFHSKEDEDLCGSSNRDPSVLNRAYAAQGWETGVLEQAKKRHEKFIKDLVKAGYPRESIEKAIRVDGRDAAKMSSNETEYGVDRSRIGGSYQSDLAAAEEDSRELRSSLARHFGLNID